MNFGQVVTPPLLAGLLLSGAFADVRWRRLPNWLTFGGASLAFVVALIDGGPERLLFSLTGWLVGVALLVPLFLTNGMGAGDVKLLGVIGAFLGPGPTLVAFIAMGLVGGIFAFFVLLLRRQLVPTLMCLWLTRRLPRLDDPGAVTLPYGVAIAAGGVIAIFLTTGGRI